MVDGRADGWLGSFLPLVRGAFTGYEYVCDVTHITPFREFDHESNPCTLLGIKIYKISVRIEFRRVQRSTSPKRCRPVTSSHHASLVAPRTR